jgi:hypothetical protein
MGAALIVIGGAGAASADTITPSAPPAEAASAERGAADHVRSILTDVLPLFPDVHDWG